MTMALLLSVPRRLSEGARILREGQEWRGWSPTWMLGHRIWGKRLGIVGMGRIGTAVGRRGRALRPAVPHQNRRPPPPRTRKELEATYWGNLHQMFARVE